MYHRCKIPPRIRVSFSMQLAFILILHYACCKGCAMEKDFIQFLSDIKYANHTANVYLWKLKKFADENGYKNLFELADDVFILLDKGTHGDRKFDADTLVEIKKHENVLTLFNSFLFDIGFKRQFVIPCYSNPNIMKTLVTDKVYIPKVQSRTLVDKEKGKITGKQYFSIDEVSKALHVDVKTLQRWADCGQKPYRYKGIPSEIAGNKDELKKYNPDMFTFYYYKLDELNEFLAYQFKYGTERKREIYMSDTDIRKLKTK